MIILHCYFDVVMITRRVKTKLKDGAYYFLKNQDTTVMQKYARVEKKKEVLRTAALILSGAVTGILSGFFGGGGGMLVVPALTLIMKLTEKQAHATAIAVILPVTVVGAVTYLLRGVSAGEGFAGTAIGVVIGGLAGAMLLNKLSNKFVSFLFYGVMIAAGIKMVL